MPDTHEKVNINEAINEFVRKNRKPIFIVFGVMVLLLAGFIVTLSVMGFVRNKAISRVEEFNLRYEALRFDINEAEKEPETAELLTELTSFAEKTSGHAGGRAWAIIGSIHADKKEWPEAEKAYTSAAKAAAKTYLAPVSYFNAAAAAEEQGNFGEAVNLYTQSVAHSSMFPAAVRAQFAIGRLQETLENKAAALDAYRGVISGWTSDTVWTNLARSRIILLEAEKEPEHDTETEQ
jgi:tetratricopeptide (TPR) repeat protein